MRAGKVTVMTRPSLGAGRAGCPGWGGPPKGGEEEGTDHFSQHVGPPNGGSPGWLALRGARPGAARAGRGGLWVFSQSDGSPEVPQLSNRWQRPCLANFQSPNTGGAGG